jgi:hypothetical protein
MRPPGCVSVAFPKPTGTVLKDSLNVLHYLFTTVIPCCSYKVLWLQKVTEQHQVTTKEVIERTRDILKVGYTVQIAGY